MTKLSKEEIGKLGLYEFQGYIGSMTSPTFGGWKGTNRLIESLEIEDMEKPKILEVGCSTGYITRHIAQKFDCEIIGVDLSTLLLDIAEEESRKLNLNNISFKNANVENLPFSDNTFDIVYGEAITALVPDPLKVLNEYNRVLKPGGKIATLDLFMKESLSDEFVEETNEMMSTVIGTQVKIRDIEEWQQIFKESGFNSIKIYDYYDDLFRRDCSLGEKARLTYKLLYHMSVNKKVRQKIVPLLKFARKFQKALKGDNYGYLIFTGVK
ncbi:class I SAM-dependent methyltransferase [Chloroflexota bacterium]